MKVLFICHLFEGKKWEDSAAKQEIVEPIIHSKQAQDTKTLVFSKSMDDYDLIIKHRVDELIKTLGSQPIIIYGAGAHTRKYIHHLKQLNIIALMDRESYLWGKTVLGYPVIAPKELEQNTYPIVISTRAYEDCVLKEIKQKYSYQPTVYPLYDITTLEKQRINKITQDTVQAVNDFKPDLIIYAPPLPNEAFKLDQVNHIKKQHTCQWITIWWDYDDTSEKNAYLDFEKDSLIYSDLILDAANYTKNIRLKAKERPYQDHQFTEKVYVGPTVCDPNIFYPRTDKKHNLLILGSAVGQRRTWIKALRKQYPDDFYHFGDGVGNQKIVPMADYARMLAQSKIFINTQTYSYRSQCKGKVREALASGVLLLEEDNPDTRQFYQAEEGIVYFTDQNDLFVKIDYYLKHDNERERLAKLAHDWYIKHYQSSVWFTKIINKMNQVNSQSNIEQSVKKIVEHIV